MSCSVVPCTPEAKLPVVAHCAPRRKPKYGRGPSSSAAAGPTVPCRASNSTETFRSCRDITAFEPGGLVLVASKRLLLESAGDARGDGDLDQEVRRIQRRDRHGGAGGLVGREVLRVLLVVGGQVRHAREVGRGGQHVVERGPGRGEDRLDAL